jgi:peptide methionine sulfoxide reductase MsrB
MRYNEREISKEDLEKFLKILDSDEGIRIDDELGHIFINKTSKRYCINTSTSGEERFVYKNSVEEVMSFLKDHISQMPKIFSY